MTTDTITCPQCGKTEADNSFIDMVGNFGRGWSEMIPEPTADDLKRDAEADYKLCLDTDMTSALGEYTPTETLQWIRRDVAAERALMKINEIRNSIIGLQTVNWSEHIYPLVCALNEAGIQGMEYPEAKDNYGTMLERLVAAERERDELRAEVERLKSSWDEARDTILNQRHELEDPRLDSDQTNAVLSVLDRCRGET